MAYYQNVNIDICGSNLLIYLNIEKKKFYEVNDELRKTIPFSFLLEILKPQGTSLL